MYNNGLSEFLVALLEEVHKARELDFDGILSLLVFEGLFLELCFCPDFWGWGRGFFENFEDTLAFLERVRKIRGSLV